jgi:hypothetical protein
VTGITVFRRQDTMEKFVMSAETIGGIFSFLVAGVG